jgi:GDP-mannose 4,6-dehydratase
MNILITGGTGFVGSHLIDYIRLHQPDAMIYASRRWRSRDENIKHMYGNKKIKFIEADLLDRGSLYLLIQEARPDYVFHFAAQSFPQTSFYTPTATLQTNAIGTTNLLDELMIARDHKVCDPVIVSVSSSEVYGMPLESELPIKETNPIRAANPYSISKVTHDLMSQYYYSAYGLKVVITRMFSHEGARRGKKFALSSFAYQIVQHERSLGKFRSTYSYPDSVDIKVGNLNSVRTYAHISDAVRAYWLAATKGTVGEVYNIGGEYTCKVGDALEKLLSKSRLSRPIFKIVVDPELIRPTDITLQVPDCTKFKQATGWVPVKSLDDIADDLLKYWREQ